MLSATDRDHDDGRVDETDDEWRRLWVLVVLSLLIAREHDEHDQKARQELDAKRVAFRDAVTEHRAATKPHISARRVRRTWN